ncbi:hypothetical protein C5Y96_17070 [Blastopirellula marina]|uniref:Uncharacterized protein n=1 Tax=Blastopirellula marina TaxID=124 RepID=A0A2S8F7F4_9BACT|nr:hypothetical protein C5Y96_17070 [Blastopirellula marina]
MWLTKFQHIAWFQIDTSKANNVRKTELFTRQRDGSDAENDTYNSSLFASVDVVKWQPRSITKLIARNDQI